MASRSDIVHLLSRVGFGGTEAEIDALVPLSWAEAVDAVLDTSRAPSAEAGPNLPAPTVSLSGSAWGDTYSAMTTWWMDRARTTPVPIVEKMVLFWSGLLTSSLGEAHHTTMFDQNRVFRRMGMGRWDDLVQAVSVHPAMLRYLDNRSNRVGRPNENFARELLELFTLGVGNYTESDVVAAARAWTGHTVSDDDRYVFRADWHDDATKTFMGTTRRWDGPEIVDHVLNGPTRPVAARYLARRLWTFLAHAEPDAALVDDLGATFSAADLDVTALVRAILLRPEFRSARARQGLVRSPFELVVAALKRADLSAADLQPQWSMSAMGQALFRPPNVDGWGTNEYWISTTTAWARAAFAERIAWALHDDESYLAGVEDRSARDAAREALGFFGIEDPSSTTLDALTTYVLEERVDRRWAQRWGLTTLTLLSPEFQLA